MNISSASYNLNHNTIMNFNLVNNDNERVTSNQRQSVFGNSTYKPIEWSQVTPQQMPWAQNPSQYSQVMQFGSPNFFQQMPISPPQPNFHSDTTTNQRTIPQQFESTSSTAAVDKRKPFIGHPSQFSGIHCKRKSEISNLAPAKQHITEERMAAHMSKLHISSETPITIEPESNQEPLAEREKRLVMCEEMRRLQTESIIPSALMKRSAKTSQMTEIVENTTNNNYSRLERPCMAVMLWQPPDKAGLIPPFSSYANSMPSTSSGNTCIDNNNTSSVNLNEKTSSDDSDDDDQPSAPNVMDMDL